MNLKKLFSLVAVVAILATVVAVAASAAATPPISIGAPQNVTVSKDGSALSVTYELGSSDRTLLQLAANPSTLAMFGVESLDVVAQIDYKVFGMTDWLSEDKLIAGPCNLTDTLSVSVSNPALAFVNWQNTTLLVRVRWAGTLKMKGQDATFVAGDWSDTAYFGKAPAVVPSNTEAEPTATEAEPTATASEPTVIRGDANDDGLVNMKDVLVLRKYLAGMEVQYNAANADANADNNIDMKDVLVVRKYLAGMPTELGA